LGPFRPGRSWSIRHVSGRELALDAVGATLLGVLGGIPLAQYLPTGGLLLLQLLRSLPTSGPAVLLLAACSFAVRRLHPGAALLLTCVAAGLQLLCSERPSLVDAAVVAVVYSAAAYGRRGELEAAAVVVVIAGALAPRYLQREGFLRIADLVEEGPPAQRIAITVFPFVVLAAAWLAGLVVRSVLARRVEARRRVLAEARASQAQDAAELERLRAAMARDVHDVVGHSLAVIIAQADGAELLDDPTRVREMVRAIARTARGSLDEVRTVLDRTGAERIDAPDALHDVLEQVRSTGLLVEEKVQGVPQELSASSAVAARRVLQEMLTNALRHGRPGGVVAVQRTWSPTGLVIQVANEIGQPQPGSGAGLAGMRSRLAAIGGSLHTEGAGDRFTARAHIPLTAEEATA
jgi:signal transduction histidine kinase